MWGANGLSIFDMQEKFLNNLSIRVLEKIDSGYCFFFEEEDVVSDQCQSEITNC